MKNGFVWGLAFSVSLGAFGCGKEVGRIPLKADGTGSTTITVKAGDKIALWTSLDASFQDRLDAHYDVRLLQNGTPVASTVCDPMDAPTKLMSTTLTTNVERRVSYQGKMRCTLTAPADGAAVIETTLAITPAPGLVVRDLSLVIKR